MTHTHEVMGYFEEFWDADSSKFLGIRNVEKPDRPTGSPGMVYYTITEPLHLLKGYKHTPVVIKASPAIPRKIIAIVQIIYGKHKNSGFKNQTLTDKPSSTL